MFWDVNGQRKKYKHLYKHSKHPLGDIIICMNVAEHMQKIYIHIAASSNEVAKLVKQAKETKNILDILKTGF